MLYREIIAVCSQIHTKHINTVCGQNVELLNVKMSVYTVTTGLLDNRTFWSSSQFIYMIKPSAGSFGSSPGSNFHLDMTRHSVYCERILFHFQTLSLPAAPHIAEYTSREKNGHYEMSWQQVMSRDLTFFTKQRKKLCGVRPSVRPCDRNPPSDNTSFLGFSWKSFLLEFPCSTEQENVEPYLCSPMLGA